MALDLNDHLLQPPNGLITALLGQLLVKIVTGFVPRLISSTLALLGHILRSLVLEILKTFLCTSNSVNTRVIAVALIIGGSPACISRVPRTRCLFRGITSGVLQIVSVEWLLLVKLIPHPSFDVASRHVRVVVPSVVFGWTVDLVELIFRRIHFVRGLLRGIADHATKEHRGVADCSSSVGFVDGWRATLTEFSELSIRHHELTKSAKIIQGFVAVLLHTAPAHGCMRRSSVISVDVLRLPNDILYQVPLVLGEKEYLGLFDDIAKIRDQVPAFLG